MSAGTIDSRDFGEVWDDYGRRLALVEQQISNPDLPIGAGGSGGGSGTNEFEEVVILNPGGPPDAVIRYVADPPTGLSITTSTFLEEVYLDISWSPGETNTPNYEIEVAKGSGGIYEVSRIYQTSGTSIRVTVDQANTDYGVRVASINRAGIRSAFTSWMDVTSAIDNTIPPAVSNLVVTAGLNTVIVTFDRLTPSEAPDMQNGNGLYRIQISSNDFATILKEKYTSSNIESFEGLTQGTNYKVRVAPVDSSGNQGPWNTSANIQPGYVTDSVIGPGTISGDRMVAGSIAADRITASSITTAQIAAGGINGDRITTNTLDANRIKTSTLTAADITLAGGSLRANNPVSGTGVLINSQGIRVYKSSVLAVNLDAVTGDVLVNGVIAADQFTMLRSGVEVGRLQSYPANSEGYIVAGLEFDHGVPISKLTWDTGRPSNSGGNLRLESAAAVNSGSNFTAALGMTTRVATSTNPRAIGTFGISGGGRSTGLSMYITELATTTELGLPLNASGFKAYNQYSPSVQATAEIRAQKDPFAPATVARVFCVDGATTSTIDLECLTRVTVTAPIHIAPSSGSDEKLRLLGSGSYISFYDNSGVTRQAYITTTGSGNLVVQNEGSAGVQIRSVNGDISIPNNNFALGKTATDGSATPGVEIHATAGRLMLGGSGGTNLGLLVVNRVMGTGNGASFADFRRAGTTIGSVTIASTSTVAYNTSSDERLKNVLGPIEDALDRLRQMNPVRFEWKADGLEDEGFIAQELIHFAPRAVTPGGKNVKEKPWMVDYSKVVPVLAAALKQTIAIVDSQAERIEALEARLAS